MCRLPIDYIGKKEEVKVVELMSDKNKYYSNR